VGGTVANTANTIWVASRDERLQRFIWTALASQKMTPVTAPAEASLDTALANLAARGGRPSAAILDMAWIKSDQLDISAIMRSVSVRGGNPAVFLLAATARLVPENASRWARALGAHAILPRLSDADESAAELAIGTVSKVVGIQRYDARQLKAQLLASGNRVDHAPASTVQRLTGRSAGAVAEALAAGVEIADRPYGMKRYAQCFVGTQGVSWLAAQYGIGRSAAVLIGRALVQLGYVHHVLKEHDFEDENLFYRVAPVGRYERIDLSTVVKLLWQTDGLIADRSWRATSYPSCFVGQEAVDLFVSQYRLSRAEATALVQSLVDLGVVCHVTGEHEFTDGMFYFRFLADARLRDTVKR